MRIRVLGSGASDGWPNPWCACASCTAALAQGVVRGHTSVLLDGVLLLDIGPDGPRAAARFGETLAGVEAVLVTHRHLDHHFRQAWVWRGWVEAGPLTVLAPPLVLADAEGSFAGNVTTLAAVPGDRHVLAGYAVTVLPAEHPDDAVLYDVTGPDGGRLLYATDTGVLPEDVLSAVQGRAFDVVLLELAGTPIPSHLTLETWPAQVERLRAVGAVTDRTRVVAVHLGHHNPPPHELDHLLAGLGAAAARDGEVIDTASHGRRVLVLGGQSSGKSAYAEGLMSGEVTYVATAPARDDADWARRVQAHVERRPASWQTIEDPDVAGVLRSAKGSLLIDDLGLWLTHVLEEHWESPDARAVFDAALQDLLEAWVGVEHPVVLVAPEVGSGVIPATRSGRLFADLLGRATTALAGASDEVVQVVAGQPRRLR